MNKAELIAAVAEKAGLSKKDSEKAVNAAFDTIVETLVSGEKVQMVGFGVFDVKIGGSCRIRTCDQLIKSQLLYQLS